MLKTQVGTRRRSCGEDNEEERFGRLLVLDHIGSVYIPLGFFNLIYPSFSLGLRIECAMLVINFHCYLFLWGQTLMVGVSQNLVPTLLVSPESIIHQPASHLHFGISSPPLLFSLSSPGILIPPILIVWKMQANPPSPYFVVLYLEFWSLWSPLTTAAECIW